LRYSFILPWRISVENSLAESHGVRQPCGVNKLFFPEILSTAFFFKKTNLSQPKNGSGLIALWYFIYGFFRVDITKSYARLLRITQSQCHGEIMLRTSLGPLCLIISGALATTALADEVLLDDGSLLKGTIQQIADGKLVIDTAFADAITIDFQRVERISTDKKFMIELDSADRIVGQIAVDETGQHQLTGTSFGNVALDPNRINSMWDTGAKQPQTLAMQQEVEEMKTAYESEIQTLRQQQFELENPWTGNIAIGMQGASGNTDRFAATGRGELYRTTDAERMAMYLEINYAKENDEQTQNEKLAGISLERDITDMYYARGSADFEIDDFENLDLRAITTASLGRFFIRDPGLVFKGFAGVGYRFESYSDGTNEKDPTAVFGYEVNYKLNNRMRLFHDTTYFPSFSSPGTNYLLTTNFGGELPITNDEAWKLRASLRSQYNSRPQDDAKNTDTSYRLNLVYDWQ